jgi:hypothetical protein
LRLGSYPLVVGDYLPEGAGGSTLGGRAAAVAVAVEGGEEGGEAAEHLGFVVVVDEDPLRDKQWGWRRETRDRGDGSQSDGGCRLLQILRALQVHLLKPIGRRRLHC